MTMKYYPLIKMPEIIKVFCITVVICSLHYQALIAQKYISRKSMVSFFSEAPLENIKADNSSASSVLDLETGEIVFSVPIRGFKFPKSLMQKHFNENYMESEIYPKSTFKGIISGYNVKDGHYDASAAGELAIHGVTRKVQVTGEMNVNQNELTLSATFPVALEDYDIKIPTILFSNIAENIDVTIEFIYKPYVTN